MALDQTTVQNGLAAFEKALPALRPQVHRYCARMTGSVVDGEDVLQEALLKASTALKNGAIVEDLRPWLFRIAHNTAMNHFRNAKNDLHTKQEIRHELTGIEQMPMRSEITDNLRPFLNLTPKQRSTVILRDILGYSAQEVSELTQSSLQSVKSALHRGRQMLSETALVPAEPVSALSNSEREQLQAYASYFNAHDFDRLRDMLSAEVKLDLVSREKRQGKQAVGGYFGNYQKVSDWFLTPGLVEGRPALLVFDPDDFAAPPVYFVLLSFVEGQLSAIQDYRYARYVMADARWERTPLPLKNNDENH